MRLVDHTSYFLTNLLQDARSGALVLPGVTIGDRSIVGAGSVVVHNVPPDSLVVGNPARIVRTLV